MDPMEMGRTRKFVIFESTPRIWLGIPSSSCRLPTIFLRRPSSSTKHALRWRPGEGNKNPDSILFPSTRGWNSFWGKAVNIDDRMLHQLANENSGFCLNRLAPFGPKQRGWIAEFHPWLCVMIYRNVFVCGSLSWRLSRLGQHVRPFVKRTRAMQPKCRPSFSTQRTKIAMNRHSLYAFTIHLRQMKVNIPLNRKGVPSAWNHHILAIGVPLGSAFFLRSFVWKIWVLQRGVPLGTARQARPGAP